MERPCECDIEPPGSISRGVSFDSCHIKCSISYIKAKIFQVTLRVDVNALPRLIKQKGEIKYLYIEESHAPMHV